MALRHQHQNGMSHLKSCIEASNALKNATDETVNACFTQIVNEIFGGKRNLLQSLLSPQSNLKQQQIRQMKQIFHTKFQEIMDTKSDTDAIDGDPQVTPQPCIATLINIAEPTQIVITSFLDFKSVNQLKNVCSSIAPICIAQLLNKMDIKTLNVHELMHNCTDQIKIHDIIESSLQTQRVHRAHTLKSFVQKETTIAFDNLLCFKTLTLITMRQSTRLLKINALTTMRDLKASVLLFMDKSLLPQTLLHCSPVGRRTPMIFVQEFDIKHQSLRITDVVITFTAIKQMITNKIHEDITLYYMTSDGDVEEFMDYHVDYSGGIMTIFYERNINKNMSQSAKEEMKVSNYKKLEPFAESLQDFYQMNTSAPGFKYNQLARRLQKDCQDLVPYEDISKCLKKAYDLNPDHPGFIYNYIDSLVDLGGEDDFETAHQLCLEKLKLRELPDMIRSGLSCLMGRICEYRDMPYTIAIEYYQKAVEIIQPELDKRGNTPWRGHGMFTQFTNPDPYFHPTEDLQRGLCETYDSIAGLYEEAIENEQDMPFSVWKAEEYRLKILKIKPRSAFYHQRYANYLEKYKMEYNEAIEQYMQAEQLIDHLGANDGASLHCCYNGWYNCLVELKRYTEAESLCLKWIKRAENGAKGLSLWFAYSVIISLYKKHLKQPQEAKLYSSKLESCK